MTGEVKLLACEPCLRCGAAPGHTGECLQQQIDAMDDASLAVFLNLTDEEAAIIIPKLTPAKRATFERMASVVDDLNMGVVPDGVIVCRPKCGGRRI